MNIVFFLFVIVNIINIEMNFLIKTLYYFQLNGYSIKSLCGEFINNFKSTYLYWLVYFIILTIVIFLNSTISNFILNVLIFICFLLLLILSEKSELGKIKYTKRMIRILVVCVLLLLGVSGILLMLLGLHIFSICLPIILIINYFVVGLVAILLMPLEKLIGFTYIRKTRKVLDSRQDLIRIGITGSYGKTSTKEILNTILCTSLNVLSTPKSFNTPFGVTKTILGELANSTEVFICEMGAKRKGDISTLCKLVDVDLGIVTAVGRQHLSTFGSIDGVYKTKKELPDYLLNKKCVFNLQNKFVNKMYRQYCCQKIGVYVCNNLRRLECCRKLYSLKLVKKSKNIKFSYYKNFSSLNNVYAKKVQCFEGGSTFKLYYNGNYLCSANTILLGVHNIINILLAVAMSIMLSVSIDNIKIGIQNIKPIKARLEKFVTTNGAIIINNGYNSNIDTARSSLKVLDFFNKKFKVVITPGLIETDNKYMVNYEFAKILAKHCNMVYCVKDYNRIPILAGLQDSNFNMENVKCFQSFNDIREILNNANDNYVFLIENDLPDNYK